MESRPYGSRRAFLGHAECEEPGVRRAAASSLECPVDADNACSKGLGPGNTNVAVDGWVGGREVVPTTILPLPYSAQAVPTHRTAVPVPRVPVKVPPRHANMVV